jgi:hypothetical protein
VRSRPISRIRGWWTIPPTCLYRAAEHTAPTTQDIPNAWIQSVRIVEAAGEPLTDQVLRAPARCSARGPKVRASVVSEAESWGYIGASVTTGAQSLGPTSSRSPCQLSWQERVSSVAGRAPMVVA